MRQKIERGIIMKRYLSSLLLIAMLVLLLLPAAVAEEGNPLDYNGDGKLIVAIEVQDMASSWHTTYASDLEKFWMENGADQVIISSSELDVNKGITDLESFYSAGVDVVFMVPDSTAAVKDVVKTLLDTGKILISVNCPQAECPSTIGSNFDHYAFGAYVGEAAGKWLLSKGYEKEAVILDAPPMTKQELVDRYDGMKDKLLELCPDIQIAMETVSADAAAASSNAEMALTANPNAKAIITLGDGLSIFEVVNTLGLNIEDFGLFCGEQSEAQAQTLIENEAYRSFLIFGLADSNLTTSYEMLKLLKGEEYNDEPVLGSPGACTKENVYEWYPKLKK